MVEDYRPLCYWCNKQLNKKGRYHLKKTGENLCYKCFEKLKNILKDAGINIDIGEDYPWIPKNKI